MNATVIYPKHATFQVAIPDEHSGKFLSALNWLWEALQNGISEIRGHESVTETLNKNCDAKLRSSMVGDVYILEGEHFMVNGTGFIRLTPTQSFEVQRADDVDRLMGWKWMAEHKNVTGTYMPLEET
jgi:hypothetical protein